jgi:hypothetical protein
MKRITKTLFALIMSSTLLHGAGEESVPGYRASYPENAIGISNLTIGPQKTHSNKFIYSDTNLLCNPDVYKSDNVEASLLFGIRDVHMSMSDKLKPKNTPYGVVGVNGIYDGVQDWCWTGGLSLQSSVKQWNLLSNTRYIGALLGRYAYKPNTGLSVGLYSELGFRANIVRPIVGLDYSRGNWVLEAIYPVKAGLVYKKFAKHQFSAVVRPFYTALKNTHALHHSPAVSTFKGYGYELRYDYIMKKGINLWTTLGYTGSCNLHIGDRHNNHIHHYHLASAPYFSLGLMVAL